MIQVIYNEVEDAMILRAEGHAGFAEKGKDIVCAAVSVLMQTLACSVGTCMCNDGKVFSVVCKKSNDNIAKFELVTDGLALLQREYPENVRYINATERKTKALELQLFADGGAASTGDAAPAADNAAEGGADPEATDSAAEGSGSEDGADKGEGEAGEEAKKLSPAERRRAFGQMMSGEYKDLADEMMQNAVQIAAQNLEASPEMRGLLEAIAEKYGTDATDLTALTDAIRNGVVKDDAYFEKIAMEKGISVKTAREMDKLETQNKRLTAQQQAAQQMQKAAAERARIAQIQARWDAEADALQAKYPDFDRGEVLANPEVEKMMRAGCSMEAAYRAAYFDRLMARQTAATAQQTEQGVLNRVQQRASRPAENGTRPGGAVQTHIDVEHMSRKDREALEKRVLRGEIITL